MPKNNIYNKEYDKPVILKLSKTKIVRNTER